MNKTIEVIDMMVGKVAYNGYTFNTANKLQRWFKDQIESEMGIGAHLT